MKPANALQSPVFRRTLLIAVVFAVIVFIGALLVSRVLLLSATQNDRQEILDTRDWMVEVYEEGGIGLIQRELEVDEQRLWDDEEGFWHTFEGETTLLIARRDRTPLFGHTALNPLSLGWSWQTLRFEDEAIRVRLWAQRLGDGNYLVVGRARGNQQAAIRRATRTGLFWVLITVIPCTLLAGYLSSRLVRKRLSDLSQEIDAIGHGELSQRLKVRGQDEFDRLATQANLMLDRISALNKNIETVSVGIAHDLKTPLSRLANRIELLESDIQDSEKRQEHLASVRQQIDTLLAIFQNLLRLSEIESGSPKKSFSEVNLSRLARDMVETYEPVYTDSHRALEAAILEDIWIDGDAGLLSQMMSNLLENSLEHGRDGGKTWLRLQRSKTGVVLQIGDDGPGIPADQRLQIFDRFFRGEQSRSAPGHGLGLSIVRSIVALHSAEISLLDDNFGAVFDIEFSTKAP